MCNGCTLFDIVAFYFCRFFSLLLHRALQLNSISLTDMHTDTALICESVRYTSRSVHTIQSERIQRRYL